MSIYDRIGNSRYCVNVVHGCPVVWYVAVGDKDGQFLPPSSESLSHNTLHHRKLQCHATNLLFFYLVLEGLQLQI